MPNPLRADDLFAAWGRGQFKPVYLFSGQEDFLIEEALQQLRARRLAPGSEDTHRDRLDAEEVSASEIIQACQTMPFGGDCRFVEVRNCHRLSGEDQKTLAASLTRLPASTQLVLTWGKEWRRDDAARPLLQAVMSLGAAVIFWPFSADQAQRWLLQRAGKYKKTLTADAAARLIQEAGEGLRRLDQELIKVCVYVGERPEVHPEDVEACSGYQKALSPYEWLAAIRGKKQAESLRTLRHLLADQEEPLKLLAMATGSLRDWIETKESGQRPQSFVRPGAGWRGSDERGGQDLEKRSIDELVEGLSFCVQAHQSIKTGKETPSMAMTLLTLRLCGESLNPAG